MIFCSVIASLPMKKLVYIPVLAGCLLALSACSGSEVTPEENTGQQETATQQFTIVVESIGELFTQADSRRPISSVDPEQSFDKVSLIIARYESPAEVVYMKNLDGWSDTHNQVSVPWSQGDSRGRKAVITLTGDECLEDDCDYLVYAIGYQSGTYGGYEAFAGVKPGDNFFRTETADVPEGGIAEEIFAGAEFFHVRNGKIYSVASSDAEAEEGVVVLRRQVAGTFGYFTRVPATVAGQPVVSLQLVTTRKNRTVIFGGFRGVDDEGNFRKENVINGMNPRTDYNATLAGSAVNDAFVVYRINLANWFPGNTANPALPLDQNGDGYLDAGDTN